MTITRVRWRERQRVSAADLRAEQLYRLEGLGRHFLAPHDWGVVRGLWLIPEQRRYSLRWRLAPGVAIDGYGRELLVREPIEIELPDDAEKRVTYRVFLYYCESPSSCPPCAPCRDDPAPRTRQHVQVVVSNSLSPITGPAADLSLARAAGTIAGSPTWPVLVGTITLGDPSPVNAEVRYHAQRASILHSPSGRVALRQGLLGPYDRYHLLLSTSPDSASPIERLAIDRDGTAHVWKQLVLSGASASAMIELSSAAALIIDAPMPAGVGRRVRLEGAIENVADPHLTLHWLDDTGAREIAGADLLKGGRAYLDQRFRFLGMHPVALRLVDAAHPARRIQVTRQVRRNKPQRALVVQQFEAELSPSGGRLALATREIPPDTVVDTPCDDDPRESGDTPAPLEEGGVAYFRPAVQPVPAPTVRAIQAVTEERPDGVPATSLRLAGGEFDDGDRSARIALGARKTDEPDAFGWRAAVTMDGGGRVRMPREATTLAVSHTLQLPPITTNPADPLTQDLLALSYSAGLRRAGRLAPSQVTIAFPTPPATVRRGDTLTYHVTIAGGALAATLKRVIECVVGSPAALDEVVNTDVALRTIPGLAGALDITNRAVTIPSFQHAAQHVVIAVDVLVAVAGKDYVLSAVSPSVAVTD